MTRHIRSHQLYVNMSASLYKNSQFFSHILLTCTLRSHGPSGVCGRLHFVPSRLLHKLPCFAVPAQLRGPRPSRWWAVPQCKGMGNITGNIFPHHSTRGLLVAFSLFTPLDCDSCWRCKSSVEKARKARRTQSTARFTIPVVGQGKKYKILKIHSRQFSIRLCFINTVYIFSPSPPK